MQSKVKWFDEQRGFGFLFHPYGGDRDIFVHARAILAPTSQRILHEGDEVAFEVETTQGHRGSYVFKPGYARDVQIIRRAEAQPKCPSL